MSDKLTEALARYMPDDGIVPALDETAFPDAVTVFEAARRWRDFPDGVLYDENGHVHEELRLAVEAAIKRYPNMDAEQWIGGVAAIRVVADWAEAVKREDR